MKNKKAEKAVDEDDLVMSLKSLWRLVCCVILMKKTSTHSQQTHGLATLAIHAILPMMKLVSMMSLR